MLITLTGNLSWLYTSDIKRLWLRVFLIFMIRTIAASIWYWRSWKTLSVVLACSSTWKKTNGWRKIATRLKGLEARIQDKSHTVSFIWIWFILILKSLCLKSSLHENLSPSSTSLLFGILVSTRAFPQASDCRVLRSSLSSVNRQQSQTGFRSAMLHDDTGWTPRLFIRQHTYSCCQLDLLQGELLAFVKHQQHKCLKKWHLQLLLALQEKKKQTNKGSNYQ